MLFISKIALENCDVCWEGGVPVKGVCMHAIFDKQFRPRSVWMFCSAIEQITEASIFPNTGFYYFVGSTSNYVILFYL